VLDHAAENADFSTTVTAPAPPQSKAPPRPKAVVYWDPNMFPGRWQNTFQRLPSRLVAGHEAPYFDSLGHDGTVTTLLIDVKRAIMDSDVRALALTAHGNEMEMYTGSGDLLVRRDQLSLRGAVATPFDDVILNGCNTSGLRRASHARHFVGNEGFVQIL